MKQFVASARVSSREQDETLLRDENFHFLVRKLQRWTP